MTPTQLPHPTHRRKRRLRELAIVLLGALALHAALLWPSLSGASALLPADLLAAPSIYLPPSESGPRPPPQNTVVSDVVYTLALHGELAREQLRAGRWPLWNPYNSCGAPLLGAAQAQAFSPFSLLQIALGLPFPRGLAWAQLARAAFGALGAYLAFRSVLRTRHGPSAFGGWAWSLHGFATLWLGYPHAEVALELPWLILALNSAIRRPRGLAVAGVACATALLLLAGHPGTAATALLGAGAFVAARALERFGSALLRPRAWGALFACAGGVALGVGLSAPQALPTLEYLPLTLRAAARAAGHVDIAPVGVDAAPLFALPYAHGSNLGGELWQLAGNHLESAAGGWVGLGSLLLLAPLAFARRRGFGRPLVLIALALLFAGQPLALPGVVELCELWPLRVLQNNRSVLVSALCVLALAVLGLDRAWRSRIAVRWPAVLALLALIALGGWSLERAITPPSGFAGWLDATGASDPARAATAAASFAAASKWGAIACALATLLALALLLRRSRPRGVALATAALTLLELAVFHTRQVTQSDAALAYPRIPALEALAADSSARIVGMGCLPAALNLTHLLRDIRGYDGLDPAPISELMELFRHPRAPKFSYAATQWFTPNDSPLLDMLGVRYLVRRGRPQAGQRVVAQSPGYHVTENEGWLPRAWVARRAQAEEIGAPTLERLARADFDPRAMAFVAPPFEPPPAESGGNVELERDEADRVVLAAELDAPGLVVLSDAWYPGWRARIDGEPASLLRVNHALRGVLAPAGRSRIELSYEPESFARGVKLMWLSASALLAWSAWVLGRRRLGAALQR